MSDPLRPNAEPSLDVRDAQTAAAPVIAGHEILGPLGQGGMGVVYKAYQTSLKRTVALKMIRTGSRAGPEELARFRREAEAVARLQHPNIVQIFHIGETRSGGETLPYLSLEFVDGGNLAVQIEGKPFAGGDAEKVAQLVETLARAVHFAHLRGIVHRDLKPANVLLTADGTPKISDFGLARHMEARGQGGEGAREETGEMKAREGGTWERGNAGTERKENTGATGSSATAARPARGGEKIPLVGSSELASLSGGTIVGTAGYMAPEQAWGASRVREIGPAADVYGLGVILYEMLTGQVPFKGDTPQDVLEQVWSKEPTPPSVLISNLQSQKPLSGVVRKIPRDLETICLKCLQKEPGRRYESAAALAEDLRRFHEHEPIQARRVGRAERAWLWSRRKPLPALLSVLLLAVFLGGFGGVTVKWREALEQRRVALDEKKKAENATAQAVAAQEKEKQEREKAQELQRQAEAARVAEAAAREQAEKAEGRAKAALARAEEALYFNRIALADREWEANHLQRTEELLDLCVPGASPSSANQLFHSPLEWAFPISTSQPTAIRSAISDLRWFRWEPPASQPTSVPASGGGWRALLEDSKKTRQSEAYRKLLAQVQKPIPAPSSQPETQPLNPQSAAGPPGNQVTEQPGNRKEDVPASPPISSSSPSTAPATAYLEKNAPPASPPVPEDLRGFEWRYLNQRCHTEWAAFNLSVYNPVYAVLSPDGKRLAVTSVLSIEVVNAETGAKLYTLSLSENLNSVWSMAFSPDGRWLAATGAPSTMAKKTNGNVYIWNAETGALVKSFPTQPGAQETMRSLAFSPDSRWLAVGGYSGPIWIWDVESGQIVQTLKLPEGSVYAVAFSPNGQKLFAVVSRVSWFSVPRELRSWTVADWQAAPPVPLDAMRQDIECMVFSPDGRLLAIGGDDRLVQVWDVETLTRKHTFYGHTGRVNHLAFSPDGRRLVSASWDGTARIWEIGASDAQPPLVLRAYDGRCTAAFFRADGRAVISTGVSDQREMKIWAVDEAAAARTGRTGKKVEAVAVSPDSRWVASAGAGGAVGIWAAQATPPFRALQRLFTLQGRITAARRVAFSPDGKFLALFGTDSQAIIPFTLVGERAALIEVWNLQTRKLQYTLPDIVGDFAFSPDGKTLVSGGLGHTLKIFDAPTGQILRTLEGNQAPIRQVLFSADGRRIASLAYESDLFDFELKKPPPEFRLWDAATGAQRPTAFQPGRVKRMAFSPDGEAVAFANNDQVSIYRLATGEPISRLSGFRAGVIEMKFSPDSRRFVTASKDTDGIEPGDLRLWDVKTGQEVLMLRGHADWINDIVFSPDGAFLLSGSDDGTIKIWDAPPLKNANPKKP